MRVRQHANHRPQKLQNLLQPYYRDSKSHCLMSPCNWIDSNIIVFHSRTFLDYSCRKSRLNIITERNKKIIWFAYCVGKFSSGKIWPSKIFIVMHHCSAEVYNYISLNKTLCSVNCTNCKFPCMATKSRPKQNRSTWEGFPTYIPAYRTSKAFRYFIMSSLGNFHFG